VFFGRTSTLLFMRILAFATMLIAWFFYGAMPALANCPICDSGMIMPAVSAAKIHGTMGDMPGMAMDHASIIAHSQDKAAKDKPANPCADGMAHVGTCAACLAMPPQLAADLGKALAFSYPVPAESQPLADSRPAPAAPPPRFA
jgi:hypothetical protein